MRACTGAWLEVSLAFLLVIGVCKSLSPFVRPGVLVLVFAGLCLYVPLFLLFRTRTRPEEWGITERGFLFSVKMSLLFSLLFLPAYAVLYWVYRSWWFGLPLRGGFPEDWLWQFFYHLLCVALPEEVFYRGYIQSRLNEAFRWRVKLFRAPVGFGWLYATVLFALGHYVISLRPETLTTFFPGLLFGWLRERTGSVVASTLFHALCNTTVLLLV